MRQGYRLDFTAGQYCRLDSMLSGSRISLPDYMEPEAMLNSWQNCWLGRAVE